MNNNNLEIRRRNKINIKKHKKEMLKQKIIGAMYYMGGIYFFTKGEIICGVMYISFGMYIFARDKFILF